MILVNGLFFAAEKNYKPLVEGIFMINRLVPIALTLAFSSATFAGVSTQDLDQKGAALLRAAALGQESVVRDLLGQGVPVDYRSRPTGPTALIFASAACEREVAQVLIENHADLNAVQGSDEIAKDGVTPLILAADRSAENPRCAKLVTRLIRAGAKIPYASKATGLTALDYALMHGEGNLQEVKMLTVGLSQKQLETALFNAVTYQHLGGFYYLVAIGVELNGRETSTRLTLLERALSPLVTSEIETQELIVQTLVGAGATATELTLSRAISASFGPDAWSLLTDLLASPKIELSPKHLVLALDAYGEDWTPDSARGRILVLRLLGHQPNANVNPALALCPTLRHEGRAITAAEELMNSPSFDPKSLDAKVALARAEEKKWTQLADHFKAKGVTTGSN